MRYDPLIRYEHVGGLTWRAIMETGHCDVTFSRERGYPGLFRDEVHADFYVWAVGALADVKSGRLHVLDAGCGSGYGARILSHYGHRVTSCDPEREAVAYARMRYGHLTSVEEGALATLPYDAGAFDAVVSSDSFEHAPDGGAAAEEVCRVLAPGGLFVITTPDARKSNGDNPHHPHEYEPDELGNLLTAAGFASAKWGTITGWPGHFGMIARKP